MYGHNGPLSPLCALEHAVANNQGSRSTASFIPLVRVRPFARGSLGVDREPEPDVKFHLAQRPLTAAGRSSVLRLTDAIPARPLEPRYPYGVSRLHLALVPACFTVRSRVSIKRSWARLKRDGQMQLSQQRILLFVERLHAPQDVAQVAYS